MVALSYAQVKSGGPSVARIDLVDVNKTLREPGGRGSTFSIQNLSLRVPDGRTLVVLGPSGCGKTTLLKIIAGLIPPDSGEVRYDDVDVREVRPGDRRIGMVFQSYALYPHVTSKTNGWSEIGHTSGWRADCASISSNWSMIRSANSSAV